MGEACPTSVSGKVAPPGKVTDLQKASPIVGWEQYYDPGSGELACWEWVSGASRAYVNFDIFPTLKGKAIVAAELKWDPDSNIWTKGVAEPSPGAFAVCYLEVHEATGAWQSFNTPGELITSWTWPTWPSQASAINVRPTIQKWVDSNQKYFGFFFTSVREDLPHGSNNRCLTTLKNLRLVVTYKNKP
jgi:hypothetical protein